MKIKKSNGDVIMINTDEVDNVSFEEKSQEDDPGGGGYTPVQPDLPISFDVINQEQVQNKGFGVFGYYTEDGDFDSDKSTPNFMYNQQVNYNSSKWTYEPVKYWPDEYSNGEKLTFFAYAPWVDVTVSTGVPVAPQNQEKNITQISKHTATGDPIVKYMVDTNPTTSVDLLWGVAADGTSYTPINGESLPLVPGCCFVDLVKENVAATGKISWNFKHALARLNVQIIAVVDEATPAVGTTQIGTEGDGTVDNHTNVWVRSISLSGFTMKGALNLHSDDVASVADAEPNWKSYDGNTELVYDESVIFYDGLKDGKELNEDNSINPQKNEKPTGLNPIITAEDPATDLPTDAFVNLWDGTADANAPIYVIPTNEQMDIRIVYDVETEDDALAGTLSNGHKGSSIENKIFKENVFPAIEAGKAYQVKIYVGLTSVKFEAVVTDWDESTAAADVELPENN